MKYFLWWLKGLITLGSLRILLGLTCSLSSIYFMSVPSLYLHHVSTLHLNSSVAWGWPPAFVYPLTFQPHNSPECSFETYPVSCSTWYPITYLTVRWAQDQLNKFPLNKWMNKWSPADSSSPHPGPKNKPLSLAPCDSLRLLGPMGLVLYSV